MRIVQKHNLVAAVACLAAISIASTSFAQEKIKVSIPSPSITAFCMGIRLARHPALPFAKKYDLAYEDIAMPIPQVPVNISGNQIDIGECSGISTVLNAWNKGAKNLFVFAFGSELPVYQIVAAPQYKKLSDLKGKNIGIPGIQSAGAEAIEMSLKRGANLLPNRDYQYVTVGAGPATMAALLANKIDAIPYFPPFTYELEKRGFPPLADVVTYVPQYITGTHVVSRQWAERNRPLFNRVLKSLIETGEWLRDPANESAVLAFFADHIEPGGGQGKMDQITAKRTYDFYVKDKRLSFNGHAPESAVRANVDILKERGYITDAEVPPLGQVFDFSYLNQALREMGRPEVKEYAK